MPILNTLAETQNAVITDDAFGERVLLKPRHRGRIDPERADREIVGVLRTGPDKNANMASGVAQSWRTMLAAGVSEIAFDQHRYPDLDMRQGDELVALERPGTPWFKVEIRADRGAPRLVFELSEAAGSGSV